MKYIFNMTLILVLMLAGSLAGAEELEKIPLKDFDSGQTTHLSGYLGKPLVVNFWAPWCIPCKAEFPELEALLQTYKNKAGLVAVTAEKNSNKIKKFLSGMVVTFPILTDETAALHKKIPVTGMPFTVLLRPDGTIEKTFIGYTREQKLDALETALKKLIETP